jgi:hypothetical protein
MMKLPPPPKLMGTAEEKLDQLYRWLFKLYEELEAKENGT